MASIYHITPTNDLKKHIQHSTGVASVFVQPVCKCPCEPTAYFLDGTWFFTHNSFDGREGVEWANEILQDVE